MFLEHASRTPGVQCIKLVQVHEAVQYLHSAREEEEEEEKGKNFLQDPEQKPVMRERIHL